MSRRAITLAAATLLVAACSDQPTAVRQPDLGSSGAQTALAPTSSTLLSSIPVTGALSDGGTFAGTLSLTNLALQNGQLVGTGTLTGTATDALGTVTQITQTFTNIPLSLLGSGSGGGQCGILDLDIGAIHLDLLGLVVDLAPVHLNITAQSGPGNLLGNLLCGVAHLLDSGGPLSGIQNLLNQINGLLGGLL